MNVQPTVKDVSRGIARLDAHAATPDKGVAHIDGQEWTRFQLQKSVAGSIAFQLAYSYPVTVKARRHVTKRDVAVILASHGASTLTIEQHARAIAALIRSDFTDGR